MMTENNLLLQALWAVFVASATWYVAKAAFDLPYAKLSEERRRGMQLPLLLRIILPLTPLLMLYFARPRFQKWRTNISKKLTAAGLDDVITPEQFLALRTFMPMIIGPLLVLIMAGTASFANADFSGNGMARLAALSVAVIAWSFFYPQLWLRQIITARHKLILRALPFVIDLLTLSVEAGLDFMAALRNISERRKNDPLGEELARTCVEIQLGATRRAALKKMSDRIQQPDIRALVTALAQADELGVSIASILRIQSDHIRAKRFMRAEKLANEAPVKMLFPLVACIFPAVFLILLGPILLQLLQQSF